jgi:hypothetical protein
VVGREETMCRCRRESGDRLELGTSKLCERANRRRGRVNHATTMREMRLEMGRRGVDEKSRARRLRRDEEMVMMVMVVVVVWELGQVLFHFFPQSQSNTVRAQ